MMDFSVKENSMVQGNGLDHMDNLTKVTFIISKVTLLMEKRKVLGSIFSNQEDSMKVILKMINLKERDNLSKITEG
jgi:hypothetical protein